MKHLYIFALFILCAVFAACNDQTQEDTPRTLVTGASLVSGETLEPISEFDPLTSGATLDLATLPTRNLSVRLNTEPSAVGSVRVTLKNSSGDAQKETESVLDTAPYTLKREWTPGDYTLNATPYSGAGASGAAGTPFTLTF